MNRSCVSIWCRYVAFAVALVAAGALQAAEPVVLLQADFRDGAGTWQGVNQATVSDVARRAGGHSLRIEQRQDSEQDSAWLSPVLKNPGTPIDISLWAADNYLQCKDFSFSAAFELIPCDAAGTLLTNGGDWTHIPWEDNRRMHQFPHTKTEAGLVWKHYSATKKVGTGEYFRLRLCWPKSRMQGECYFTDVQLTTGGTAAAADAVTAVDAAAAADAGADAASRYTLEISTAESANLFFVEDPLRFEFLLYDPSGAPVEALVNPTIRYEVTDYEYFAIAKGELPFANPKPIAVGKRDTATLKRSANLHLTLDLPEGPAKAVGREFFLRAELVSGGKVLASDMITYGVVNPRKVRPDEVGKSRFIAFYEGDGVRNEASAHEGQTLMDKVGTSMHHDWDYSGWKKAQPTKDSPITITPGPTEPKLVYCPNLEQVRGRKPGHPWGDMSKTAPEWALLDDPLNPGCKTFEIDPYVAYIVAYVRANRARIVQVVPSGLERSIDARTLELQRKVYAALKAEFPDLPVGMMVWEVLSESGRQLIMKEKLYEVADFFDTHVYRSAVDWDEWEKLDATLKKKGMQRPLISTEFARVGGRNQLERARDLVTSNLDAHAHGMFRITNFLMYVGNNGPIRETVGRGEFPGLDGFPWMQYVDRPRVSPRVTDKEWRNGLYGRDTRGSSMMPMLHAMAYINFVQNVDCADFKAVLHPTDRSIAYVYERDGKTIVYVFLSEPAAPTLLRLAGDTPYTMQDLYGRVDRVTPASASLLVATLDPLALVFDGVVPALYDATTAAEALSPVAGGVALPTVARGAAGEATVTLPPVFGKAFTARVEATVDGTWPATQAQQIAITDTQGGSATLPIQVAANREPASYTFTTRVYDGDALVSVLKQPLTVGEVLDMTQNTVPMTRRQDPAIAVTITSRTDAPMSGTVTLDNVYFGEGYEPAALSGSYTLPPRGTVVVQIPVPRAQVNLSASYTVRATLRDASGFTITAEDDIAFQACEKATGPIAIDGDLADWNTDALLPMPFDLWYRGPRDPAEFGGTYYTRWDDERLYFAAVITDNVPVVTGETQVEWNDDNIMLGIYPWRWHKGEPLNTGYYREHLGPIKGGGASFLRVGYVPSGPSTAEGAEIAVTRTATGWVYEWAYPRAALHPLSLKAGSGFRLSFTVWDQHQVEKKGWGQFTWLTLAGFNTSVNAQPNLWKQFTFVE